MKAVTYKLNTILAALVGVICLVLLLVRTFMPEAILPLVDIPNLAAVCAAALVIDCYFDLKSVPKRDWVLTAVLAFLTFGVTGLVAIPVLFVLGVQSLAAARLLAARGCDRRPVVHGHGLPVQRHP